MTRPCSARSSLLSARSSRLVGPDEAVGSSEFLTDKPDLGARVVVQSGAGYPVQPGLGIGLDRIALRRLIGVIERKVQRGAVPRRLRDLRSRVPPGIGQRVAFHRGRDARWRGVDAIGIFLVFVWRVA